MHSKLTKNNSKTLDKAILNDNLKEISLSDEFGNFSIFPKNQAEPQTQEDSTTLDNELGPKKPNSMQISQKEKPQRTNTVDIQFKLINKFIRLFENQYSKSFVFDQLPLP